jgi:hypothetical protein
VTAGTKHYDGIREAEPGYVVAGKVFEDEGEEGVLR